MDFLTFLSHYSGDVLLAALGLMILLILAVPLALKLAGLSGQQIADLLTLSMQFFVNLLHEFRAQNKGQGGTD